MLPKEERHFNKKIRKKDMAQAVKINLPASHIPINPYMQIKDHKVTISG
jgi:hypothetical protein